MQIYAGLFSVRQHNYIFMPILVIIIFSAIRLPASYLYHEKNHIFNLRSRIAHTWRSDRET